MNYEELLSTASVSGAVIIFILVIIRPLMPYLTDWVKSKFYRRGIILNESNHLEAVSAELKILNSEIKTVQNILQDQNKKIDGIARDTIVIKDRTDREK